MNQLSTATAVADAISLLDQYFVEDGKYSKTALSSYVEWLCTHGRQELADLVRSNAYAADTLRDLLEQRRA